MEVVNMQTNWDYFCHWTEFLSIVDTKMGSINLVHSNNAGNLSYGGRFWKNGVAHFCKMSSTLAQYYVMEVISLELLSEHLIYSFEIWIW